MYNQILILLCVFLGMIPAPAYGQKKYIPNMDIGIGVSGNVYIGDLSQKITDIRNVYPGISIGTRFTQKERIFSTINLNYNILSEQLHDGETMTITGPGYQASTYFNTHIYSIDYRLQYLILKKKTFTPYLKAGGGVMRFIPYDINGVNLATNVFSRPEAENYSVFSLYIPVGFGIQYSVSPKLFVSAEYQGFMTATDYLDNIGTNGTKNGKDLFHSILFSVYYRVSEKGSLHYFPIVSEAKPDKNTKPPKHKGPAKLAKDHSKIYKSKKSLTFKNSKKSGKSSPKNSTASKNVKNLTKKEKPVVFDAYQLSESSSPVLTLNTITKEKEAENKAYFVEEKEKEYLKKNRWTPYYIQEGDSWESIAAEFDIMPEVLKKLNGVEAGVKPAPGRRIRVPKD